MAHQQNKLGSGAAVIEPLKETVSAAEEMFKHAAAKVGQKAGDAASYLGEKTDDATQAVGNGIKSLAGTVREGGPQDGLLGSANSKVAASLEASGQYLQEQGLSGIADDVAQTIRRHPLPAVFIAVGVGYLLARVLRS